MLITDQLKDTSQFSAIEQTLAAYFLQEGIHVEEMSARAIAKQLHTVPSAVSRFAQKLGFDGYPEFKKEYLKELTYLSRKMEVADANHPFSRTDKNTVIAEKIASLYCDIIDDNLTLIEHDTLQKAIFLIDRAQNIYIVSGGVENDIAKAFKKKMLKIGKNVVIENHSDSLFYRACYGNEKDCFLFISYSGELDTTLKVAQKVKENQIPSIAITSIGGNTLSQLADVTLHVSSKETLIDNLGSFSMNLSTLMLLDILYVSYFNEHYEANLRNKNLVSHAFETKRTSKISLLKDDKTK